MADAPAAKTAIDYTSGLVVISAATFWDYVETAAPMIWGLARDSAESIAIVAAAGVMVLRFLINWLEYQKKKRGE